MNTIESSPECGGESALHHIRKEYLLCRPPAQIQELAKFMEKMDERGVKNAKEVYKVTIGHTEAGQQPPIQYRITFVKHIIKQLETLDSDCAQRDKNIGDEETKEDCDDDETCALWYQALESLSGEKKEQTEPFYRLYMLPNNCGLVKIFENDEAFVAQGTTGLVTWEASIQLANWLCTGGTRGNEEVKKRKWVIELGSGCGLLATAVTKTFPHLSKYIASDGHSSAVSKCRSTLEENFGTLKSTDVMQVEEIDWMKDGEKFEKVVRNLSEALGPGVLLGADIIFDPELIPPLVNLIQVVLQHHENSIAFIAFQIRNEETLETLKKCLEISRLQFQEIYQWGNRKGIVYQLLKSGS